MENPEGESDSIAVEEEDGGGESQGQVVLGKVGGRETHIWLWMLSITEPPSENLKYDFIKAKFSSHEIPL